MTTTPRFWKALTQVNFSDAGVPPDGIPAQADGQVVGLLDGG